MNEVSQPPAQPKPKLLDRVRAAIRTRHYSRRTEDAYVHWIKRFIFFFHAERHTLFLSSLAVDAKVSASTQNQALSALLFLYKEVLDQPLPWLDDLVHAQTRRRLPVVLTREEVHAVLARLQGVPRLMLTLLYGTGMRLLECCRLRVKDVDFAANQILVRGGKGDKDRVTLLPLAVKSDLGRHLAFVRSQHIAMLNEAPDGLSFPWPWDGNTRMRAANGHGSGCSRPRGSTWTGRPGKGGGITCTNRSCSAPSRRPSAGWASPSRRPATRSGTRLLPISSKTATISAPSRSFWAIPT
jgi:integrase